MYGMAFDSQRCFVLQPTSFHVKSRRIILDVPMIDIMIKYLCDQLVTYFAPVGGASITQSRWNVKAITT